QTHREAQYPHEAILDPFPLATLFNSSRRNAPPNQAGGPLRPASASRRAPRSSPSSIRLSSSRLPFHEHGSLGAVREHVRFLGNNPSGQATPRGCPAETGHAAETSNGP